MVVLRRHKPGGAGVANAASGSFLEELEANFWDVMGFAMTAWHTHVTGHWYAYRVFGAPVLSRLGAWAPGVEGGPIASIGVPFVVYI